MEVLVVVGRGMVVLVVVVGRMVAVEGVVAVVVDAFGPGEVVAGVEPPDGAWVGGGIGGDGSSRRVPGRSSTAGVAPGSVADGVSG